MNKKIDITFVSDTANGDAIYQLASGYISTTTILFEKENIVAVVEADGNAKFYDINDNFITSARAPKVDNGKGKYVEIGLSAGDGLVELKFPIYEWIDNYPHCDGEHDRWDTRIVGFNSITLDLSDGSIK